MIGRARVTRRGVARAVLAVAVAAMAACAVYFGGRALGLGSEAPALSRGDVAVQSDAPTVDQGNPAVAVRGGGTVVGAGDTPVAQGGGLVAGSGAVAVAVQGDGPARGDGPAADGEGLVLTISVPEMCVTGQARPNYGSGYAMDADGNLIYDENGDLVDEIQGPYYQHEDISTIPLTWQISGGTAPYELEVQGQSLLTNGVEPGTTQVYCTQELSDLELFDPNWSFMLANPSVVNPGALTFEATVTDADGLSTTAAAATYVVLDCERHCDFDVFPPGYTYLILGHLMTIPDGLRIETSRVGVSYKDCEVDTPAGASGCEDSYDLYILSRGRGWITITVSGRYYGYVYSGRFTRAVAADGQATGQSTGLHPDRDKIAALGASIGASPRLSP